MMIIYKVCPECGNSSITRITTGVTILEILNNPQILNGQADYEDISYSEDFFDEAESEFECGECGHDYLNHNLDDIVKNEMITKEEWEEKNK